VADYVSDCTVIHIMGSAVVEEDALQNASRKLYTELVNESGSVFVIVANNLRYLLQEMPRVMIKIISNFLKKV
jgi:hypothetical protein